MPSPLLADAFGHHVWATVRVLDACSALDDAQLATAVPGTYGSIIQTLRHLVDGDVFYLDVLRGGPPEHFHKEGSDIPTLRAVMDAHDAVWQRLAARDLHPDADVVEYEDTRRSGSAWRRRSTTGPITAARSVQRSRRLASSRRRSRCGTLRPGTAGCSRSNPADRPGGHKGPSLQLSSHSLVDRRLRHAHSDHGLNIRPWPVGNWRTWTPRMSAKASNACFCSTYGRWP